MEMYRGRININQHFFNQEPVALNTKTGKTVLARIVVESHGIKDINEIIKILCKEGADIHFVLPDAKVNLLHFAVNAGLWSAIPLLIERGVKADQCDNVGCTPLNTLVDNIYTHFISYEGSKAEFNDYNIYFVNKLNEPLRALISKETVNRVDNGAKSFFQDKGAIKGGPPVLKRVIYLSRVLNIGISETHSNQLAQDVTSQAFSNIDLPIIEILKLFVENNADLNAQDSVGNTMLHYLSDSTRQGGYGE